MVLRCPECQTTNGSIQELSQHLWEQHLDDVVPERSQQDGQVPCPGCDVPVTPETVVHHGPCLERLDTFDSATVRWFYSPQILLCPLCGEPRSSEKTFTSHLRSDHTPHDLHRRLVAPESNQCVGCDRPEYEESNGEHALHYLDRHPAFSREPPGSEMSCPIDGCDSMTSSTASMQYHLWATHYPGVDGVAGVGSCPGCGDRVEFGDSIAHLRCFDALDGPESLEYFSLPIDLTDCFLCDYETYNRGKLGVHIKNDHVPDLLVEGECPTCRARLSDASRAEIADHYLCFATHAGESIPLAGDVSGNPCPDCERTFPDTDSLAEHVAETHYESVFPDTLCSWCGDDLRPSDSENHIRCLFEAVTGTDSPGDDSIEASSSGTDQRFPSLRNFTPPAVVDDPSERRHTAKNPLSRPERSRYYDDLYEFLELERDAAKEHAWGQYESNSASELAHRRRAIPDLMSIGKQSHPDYEDQYVLEHPVPEYVSNPNDLVEHYGIYPGSEVIVDVDRETGALPLEAVVTFVEDQTIGIALQPEHEYDTSAVDRALTGLDSGDEEPTYSVYYLLNPTPYDREEDAVDRARGDSRIDDVLTGETTIRETPLHVATLVDPSLNPSQRRAVNRAAGTNRIACIHGPPGTGKTRTLTALIEAAVAKGDTVLAVAHSNQAVDNLIAGTSTVDDPDIDSLHYAAKEGEFSIARVGQNSNNTVMQRDHGSVQLRDADVVAGTMSAAAELSRRFDLVVVDEASQASQPATLIPMTKGERVVLAGDHKQLPPYASSEDAKREKMHVSLFEHVLDVYGEDVAERLTTQYRMHETIASYPSQQFYDGSLDHGPRNASWTIDGLAPLVGIHVEGDERTEPNSTSTHNPQEAEIVADQVKRLLDEDVDPDDIGVITPYVAQIGTIAGELHDAGIENPRRIEIDTIDSFQGGEREAIVVSFVRSNERNSGGFLEFPEEGPRRLNVALTRAKRRLVLVGDFDTLGTVADHREPQDSCAELYDALREYCRARAQFERGGRSGPNLRR